MENVVRTGVDDLVDYLKGKGKLPLFDVSAALNADPKIVQSWVDFLVEEGIVGIEYKFTNPFIYLVEPESGGKSEVKILKEETLDWPAFRTAFLAKARGQNLSESSSAALWRDKVVAALDSRRRFFEDEARKRNLSPETLWSEYRSDVLKRAC